MDSCESASSIGNEDTQSGRSDATRFQLVADLSYAQNGAGDNQLDTNVPRREEGANGRNLLTIREPSSRQLATLSTRRHKEEMVSRDQLKFFSHIEERILILGSFKHAVRSAPCSFNLLNEILGNLNGTPNGRIYEQAETFHAITNQY